jgi:polyisoprenoid-binding protein YceI
LIRFKLIFILACLFPNQGKSQTFQSIQSEISFYGIDYEDIAAQNFKGESTLNQNTGDLEFTIPIQQFDFEKSLMQEHFNEKYIESDRFPTAQYNGKIIDFNLKKGKFPVKTQGQITIHGVSKTMIVPGYAEYNGKTITLTSTFKLGIEDFDIKLPKLFFVALTEEVEVDLKFIYQLKD